MKDYFWRFGTKEFGKDHNIVKGISKGHTIFLKFIPGMTIEIREVAWCEILPIQ